MGGVSGVAGPGNPGGVPAGTFAPGGVAGTPASSEALKSRWDTASRLTNYSDVCIASSLT